ncbi:MAG: hypothetical protein Q7J98_14610, partial [Kiritimatiellia bacterium]|nr:hypothetical protein [Kiritimatiellia bacterium]
MKSPENIFGDLSEIAELGPHAIIGKTVRIRKPQKCRIGDYSIIDDFSYISCGVTVGRFTHIGAQTIIIGGTAHVTIGDFVNIAPGCRLVAASHDFAQGGLCGPAIPEEFCAPSVTVDIRIDDHVLLGTGTVILPGCHLPAGLATGAMTLITPSMKLKPWTIYTGVPARVLKPRSATGILAAAQRLLKIYPV